MRRMLLPFALVASLALPIAGCGSSDDDAAGSGTATQAKTAEKGGRLTVLSSYDIDSLDPGAWYYQYTYMTLWQPTQRALYGWKPEDRQPSPDLAVAKPAVSDGGKTLTIELKPNVHYSPPLQDRTVTSDDVKYAIERAFLPQVANPYVNAYYSDIVGAQAYADGKAQEISGIETPDPLTLVIRLSRPVGVLITGQALALPATVPVPKDYAQQYDKGERSTYGEHQVFTGPYMIANDGKGKVTGYEPGQLIELVRNPSWDAETDYRPAHLDAITIKGGNDPKLASEKVLAGDDMVGGDLAVPPAVLKSALRRNEDQVDLAPSGLTRLISLNTAVAPLDNPDVRRAIAAVTDRVALRLTRGGEVVGSIPTHYIPPSVPGFEESGGDRGPGADFMANPEGDVELAMEYMRKAGYASGKYDGPPLLMVGANEGPPALTGQAFQAQLAKIGIRLTYRQVSFNAMQSKFCQVPAADVALCPNLSWGRDFMDGQSVLDPIFHGENITPANNVNFAQVNDPELNKLIDDAEVIADPQKRADAWAAIDKRVTEGAYMIPWLWENLTNVRSDDVDIPRNSFSASWDLTFASLK